MHMNYIAGVSESVGEKVNRIIIAKRFFADSKKESVMFWFCGSHKCTNYWPMSAHFCLTVGQNWVCYLGTTCNTLFKIKGPIHNVK